MNIIRFPEMPHDLESVKFNGSEKAPNSTPFLSVSMRQLSVQDTVWCMLTVFVQAVDVI
jgi:hypothetical protein